MVVGGLRRIHFKLWPQGVAAQAQDIDAGRRARAPLAIPYLPTHTAAMDPPMWSLIPTPLPVLVAAVIRLRNRIVHESISPVTAMVEAIAGVIAEAIAEAIVAGSVIVQKNRLRSLY